MEVVTIEMITVCVSCEENLALAIIYGRVVLPKAVLVVCENCKAKNSDKTNPDIICPECQKGTPVGLKTHVIMCKDCRIKWLSQQKQASQQAKIGGENGENYGDKR